jgi:hypothetical protein
LLKETLGIARKVHDDGLCGHLFLDELKIPVGTKYHCQGRQPLDSLWNKRKSFIGATD